MNAPRPLAWPGTKLSQDGQRTIGGAGRWLVIAWLVVGHPAVASALSVSPTVVELRAAAGEQAQGVFHVTNDTDQSVTITVEREPLSPSSYVRRSPDEWLILSPSSLELVPRQEAEVSYRVLVPSQTSGELAAEVVFVQNFPGEGGSGGVEVRFGMALYVSIAGTEQLDLRVEPMRLQAGQLPTVWIPITNQGNVHCRPQGMVSVMGDNGQLLAQGILSRGLPAPPAQTATFSVPLGEPLAAPGRYRLLADLTCHATADPPAHVRVEQAGSLDDTGQWTASQTPSSPQSR